MNLWCLRCATFRTSTKQANGTYVCSACGTDVICFSCGALYTDNCGPGSVLVPASDERTYQTNMVVRVLTKVEPRVCEKPQHMIDQDRVSLRCFDANGPEHSAGRHMCVFWENHPGDLHYAATTDDKGVVTWYEWGYA